MLCYFRSSPARFHLNGFSIASDSVSRLLALVATDVFRSYFSSFLFKIIQILFALTQSDFDIRFLWAHGHCGIYGNVNLLTKSNISTSSIRSVVPRLILFFGSISVPFSKIILLNYDFFLFVIFITKTSLYLV